MSEAKTYIVPDNVMCQGGNNDNLAAMAMMNNGGLGGNGMWNNPLT